MSEKVGQSQAWPRERKGAPGAWASITPPCRQGKLTREYTLAGDFSYIDLRPLFFELLSLLAHAGFERLGVLEPLLRRVLVHVLGALHGAEVRTTHGAEMGQFGALNRQGFVVEFLR